MQIRYILPLAAAPAVWAQTLIEVLAAENETLSALTGLLQTQPALLSAVGGLENITIFAPSNEAFRNLLSDPDVAARATSDPGFVAALLSYHVLNGTYYASAFLASDEPLFVPTLLTNESWSTVEGGQVVEAQVDDDSVVINSGNGTESTVQVTNLNFTGGVVHVIDNVLSIPSDLTVVLGEEDLSDLAEAVNTASLGETLTDLPELTLFAPNNEAFDRVRDVASNLTVEQLTDVLSYHAVAGQVIYSTDIENDQTVETVQGGDLIFHIRDGGVFVNDARVVEANVLVKNGVVHIIDGVLIPDADGSNGSNGSTGGNTPVVPGLAPGHKAALGTAALFGGAVALFNLIF